MNKREKANDNSKLPSSGKPRETLQFNIEKKTLIQIIISIFILLIVLGCSAKVNSTKNVYCNDGSESVSGWVSAETNGSYWVVGDNQNGRAMEFNKQKCSIKN